MATRPYFKHRGEELLTLFRDCMEDKKILADILGELAYRETRSMRDLRIQVVEALARFEADHAPPPLPNLARGRQVQPELPLNAAASLPSKGRAAQSPNSAGRDGVGDQIGRVKGKLGSIRPCGAIKGVPSRWTFPDKRDFEIGVGENPTRLEHLSPLLGRLSKTCAGAALVCELSH